MLTIAIPTYNRNERLNKSLRLLLPQVRENAAFCRLIFLDNCSPTPIAQTLPAVMDEFPEVQYQVVRNKQNIGANANILRCVEMCETEWIWCLSDDDPVLPDALTTIRQHLAQYPDCVYFNFPYDTLRQHTYTTTGIEDFIEKLDFSANLPWISSSVHQAANMQRNLKYGYQFAYSMLPHVAALLMSLGQQGKCCMSAAQIMGVNNDPTAFEHQWSIVSFAMGSPVIYDIPLPFATRQALVRKLLVTSFGDSVQLHVIVAQLLMSYLRGNERVDRFSKGNIIFHYNQIVARNYHLFTRPRTRFLIVYYGLLLRFPHLTGQMLLLFQNKLPSWLGRYDRYNRLMDFLLLPRIDKLGHQDRYERI
jgi:glycosyltransferase involved in cell wall biosynthesis